MRIPAEHAGFTLESAQFTRLAALSTLYHLLRYSSRCALPQDQLPDLVDSHTCGILQVQLHALSSMRSRRACSQTHRER
jgi:hypothetical protein